MSTKKVVAIVVLTNLMIVALLLAFLSTAGVVGAFPPGPHGPEEEAITVNAITTTATIPDANYDSGWQSVTKGTSKKFVHGLGGDVNDYLVNVVCKDTASGGDKINQDYYGVAPGAGGIAWWSLTNNIIKVYREKNDKYCDKVRVRIWITGAPIYTGP